MIAPSNNQFSFGQPRGQQIERLDHQLQTLIRSPLAEGKNTVPRIATAGEVRKLRSAREDAVRPQMDIIPPVFIVQNFSIARHQDGYGIRQQQHFRGDCSGNAVESLMSHTHILQFHRVHQMMQRNVSVAATQAG